MIMTLHWFENISVIMINTVFVDMIIRDLQCLDGYNIIGKKIMWILYMVCKCPIIFLMLVEYLLKKLI